LKQCAVISKHAGGIGLAVSKIRAKGSYVRGSNGTANGLIPMLRVFNDTARYVDQGGGKRKGSFNIYVEPWHADIFQFLALKKNHGKAEERCRDLFTALWVPDIFMERVQADGVWSLMCPDDSKGLHEVHGEEFEALYTRYESERKFKRQVPARELWSAIVQSQIESGGPFMVYKDAVNRKSNQKHLGTIQSSNLCTEIMEYTSPDEIAVCNLASISLPLFVDGSKKTFDFMKLRSVTAVIVRNLNKIIDRNFYPLHECRRSNMRHRPIGIGVQGLADVFMLLRMPFDSLDAQELNKDIFEAIYYAAVSESNRLAERDGAYPSFAGSPASEGLLQFDLWGRDLSMESKYPWKELKEKVKTHGLRNSLLTAPMPTASTSQILGNNECFEPYTSNVYVRRTLAGEFVCINKHLLRDLIRLNLWNEDMKQRLIADNGSVQRLNIPSFLKAMYKTVWEIKQREIINMAADRGLFVDQSQSMNIHLRKPNLGQMSSMHFYGWSKGLKTGMYYLRTKAATDAIKFTVPAMERTAVTQWESTELDEDMVMEEADTTGMKKNGGNVVVDEEDEKAPIKYKAEDVQVMLEVIAARERAIAARKEKKVQAMRSSDEDEKDDDYKTDEVVKTEQVVHTKSALPCERSEEVEEECLMCGS